MFVSLLNDITTNAAHSIYFTEKTTALTVGSTVTLTIDNIKEYIHTSDWYYTLPGDVVDSFFTLFTTNYFLFYNKTGDEYVDEFIKTSGIYNYSLDDISDETIEAFKKCEYGAISADFRKLSIVTCPIGEFALQRDSFKEYSFKISNNSNVVLTVGSVEKSCTIQELIL